MPMSTMTLALFFCTPTWNTGKGTINVFGRHIIIYFPTQREETSVFSCFIHYFDILLHTDLECQSHLVQFR